MIYSLMYLRGSTYVLHEVRIRVILVNLGEYLTVIFETECLFYIMRILLDLHMYQSCYQHSNTGTGRLETELAPTMSAVNYI